MKCMHVFERACVCSCKCAFVMAVGVEGGRGRVVGPLLRGYHN